jgi:2-methylcitrate dehydratase PrpD
MAVGLDVANRIGLAVIEVLHTGWLPTTLWGPIGAAAACGRILELPTIQMQNALGFAYSQIHGNRQALVEGSLAKRTQAGFAAAAGLRAAIIAAENLSAPNEIGNGMFGIRTLYATDLITPDRIEELMLGELGVRNETERMSESA